MPSSTHLMKISDYIVKSYRNHISILSMEMVCARRPEIKEYSQEWNWRGMCICKYTN